MKEKTRILVLASDRTGCSKFRSLDPHVKLESLYPDEFRVDIDYKPDIDNEEFLKQYQIIHFHRTFGPYEQMEKRMGQLRKLGIKTVMDIDDYWRPSSDHPAYHLIISEHLDKKIEANVSLPDYVMTTTPIFAKELLKYNKNVVVIPNAIDPTDKQFIPEVMEKYTDRIRVGFLGGSCYDDKTEILTENGFKLFKDVNLDEKVATLNPETNHIEYYIPDKYICEPYSGIMYSGDTREINYVVTPNHKMYSSVNKCVGHKKLNFKLNTAESIFNEDFNIKRDGIWVGLEEEYFTIPEFTSFKYFPPKKIKMDDWLKFFGFWLAEGWTSKTKGLFQTGIAQKKDVKILNEMEILLNSFGYNCTYTKDGYQVRTFDQQLWGYLSQFGEAKEKYIPKEILQLSPRQLKLLFDYYIIGDGCIDKNGRIRSWSVSKELTDNLNELSLKMGIISYVKNRGLRNSVMLDGRVVIAKSDCYQIGYGGNGKKDRRTPLVRGRSQKEIQYTGNIYYVEVKNHIIYVRRNGKSFWCGNSHMADLENLRTGIGKLAGEGYDQKIQFVVCGFDIRGEVTEVNAQTQEKKKRKIRPEETIWVKYEELFTNNYGIIKEEEYINYLKQYNKEPWEDQDKPYRRVWTKPITTYAKNYNLFDISLAPLKENKFNEVKSQLKVVEAAFHKKVLIAQDFGPYKLDLKSAYEDGQFKPNGNALLVPSIKNHKLW